MGRSRYQTYEARAPHFVTCTVLNWMPLFTRPDTVVLVPTRRVPQGHKWECSSGALRREHSPQRG